MRKEEGSRMKQLSIQATFEGNAADIDVVKKRFAEVYYGNMSRLFAPGQDENCHFTVRVFRNFYMHQDGKRDLYVLVPSYPLQNVWHGDIPDLHAVKYGTGFRGRVPVTGAVCFQLKDGVSLYLCLSPEGKDLRDEQSLGI